jgi:hypothetical protein
MLPRRARRMDANPIPRRACWGASLTEAGSGKAPSDRPALEPYRGEPAVRNLRGDRGNVGIIRSPVRASIPPDKLGNHDCRAIAMQIHRILSREQR